MEFYLFLANISHECIDFISLLNQPGEDTRCIYDITISFNGSRASLKVTHQALLSTPTAHVQILSAL